MAREPWFNNLWTTSPAPAGLMSDGENLRLMDRKRNRVAAFALDGTWTGQD